MPKQDLTDIRNVLDAKTAPEPSNKPTEPSKEIKREQVANRRRTYRKVTPELVAKFSALKVANGNGTEAIRELEPDRVNPTQRAHTIQTHLNNGNVNEYISDKLNNLTTPALQRLEELVESPNDNVAQKSVHYIIDHVRGKAISRTISTQQVINIDTVLSKR